MKFIFDLSDFIDNESDEKTSLPVKPYLNKDITSYQDEDYINEDQIDLNKYNYLYHHQKSENDEGDTDGENRYNYQDLEE